MWKIKYLYGNGLSNRRYGIDKCGEYISYYFNDKKHRFDGPAEIRQIFGQITNEVYMIYNKCHRSDGPSTIYYGKNNMIWYTAYYINGNQFYRKEL